MIKIKNSKIDDREITGTSTWILNWETDEDIDRESERDKDSGREEKILRER